MRTKFLFLIFSFIISVCIFFAAPRNVLAYSAVSNPSALAFVNPLDIFKNDLLENAAQQLNVTTEVPSLTGISRFGLGTQWNIELLDFKNLSGGDAISVLKAIAVLAINLFLIVIQVVVAILKGLLPFLS